MVEKVKFFFDVVSFITLLSRPEFKYGRDLKALIRNRADVYLLVGDEDLKNAWKNIEHPLRKSCDGYDIPCPKSFPDYELVLQNPNLCYKIDPFAIWFLNIEKPIIERFKDFFGLWVISASSINDLGLYLNHKKKYIKDDVIAGSYNNGWKNYLETLGPNLQLPPMNSIVINDRYLLNNTNEKTANRRGFFGLNNIYYLLDAFLPLTLQIPFQICIYCQHPKLSSSETHAIISKFRGKVAKLRSYRIEIAFVYDLSNHERTFHSNYFQFNLDRGYNAFYDYDRNKLNGENHFRLETYHNDPLCSGDTNYETARETLQLIQTACENIETSPFYPSDYDSSNREHSFEQIKRTDLDKEELVHNYLFT